MNSEIKSEMNTSMKRKLLQKGGRNVALLIVALFIEVAAFSIVNPMFATLGSYYTVMGQLSILLILASAETFVILLGCIDLSIASVMFLSAMVTTILAIPLGILAVFPVLGVGVAVGLVNGLLVVKGKIPSFLATLGMNFVNLGLLMMIGNGQYIPLQNDTLKNLSIGNLLIILPNSALLALALWALSSFIAFRTVLGRRIYAVGGAEIEARLAGARVDRTKVYGFILSAILSSVAGIMLCGRLGGGVPKVDLSFLMDALSATCLGGTLLTGGVGGPHKAILGASLLAVLGSGMDVAGIDPLIQMSIKGATLLVVLIGTLDRSKISISK